MRLPTLLAVSLLLGACGPDASGPPPSASSRPAETAAGSPGGVPAQDPLAGWKGRASQLLPAEVAGRIAQESPGQVDTRLEAGGDGVRHLWPSARVIEYAGMRVPRKTVVALKSMRSGVTREAFNARFFTVMDDAQRRRFEAQVEARAAEGEHTQEQAEQVKGLAASLLRKAPAQPVEGLADAAAWESGKQGGHLHVLIGQSQFTVEADISDDADANRDAAIAVARAVIERAGVTQGATR